MKKILLGIALVATLGLGACTSLKHTATTVPVYTDVVSQNTADLQVSSKKISYKLVPTGEMRRAGEKAVIATAVAEALKANGNADVLVGAQYEIKKRRSKVLYVTVEGYPATYVNIKPVK